MKRHICLACALAAAALPPVASAQQIDDQLSTEDQTAIAAPIPSERSSSLRFRISPYGFFSAKADLDQGGDVALRRAGYSIGLSTPINDQWTFSFDFVNEYSFPDITTPGGLGGSDPFNTLIGAQLLPSFTWRGEGKWSWQVGGRIEFAAEERADFGESFVGGVFGSFRRKESETFTWGLGLAVFARFEDSPWVIPLPELRWRPSDSLFIYSERVGINVQGTITDDWFLTLKTRWTPREYRLSDDASAVVPGGVLRDESVVVGLELAYRPNLLMEFSLELGGVMYQKFELLDSGGNDQFKDTTDPAPFIAARMRFQF